jgi:cardiolipin synthase
VSVPADLHGWLVTSAFVLIYAMALFNCARVITDRVSSGATIAWIFVNLTLPFVGVPLYVLVGNYRIRGYVRRHKAAVKTLESAEPPTNLAPAVVPQDPRFATFHALFQNSGESLYDLQYGACDLLIDGKSTFEAIFTAIASAKRYILVQYYIVRSDRLGLELQRLLMEKARAGIPVYVLYDDMGSFWLSRHYINALRAAGVKVARFLPIGNLKRR